MLSTCRKSPLNNCLAEVEFYGTLKSGDQIQSTMGDIFMKRKLGIRRPHILHQFCARERMVQRVLSTQYFYAASKAN